MRQFLLDGWLWIIIIFFGGAIIWVAWRAFWDSLDYIDRKKWNKFLKRLDDADRKNHIDIWKGKDK
jgi:hypothetical protein